MRAMVLHDHRQPLSLEQPPIPKPGPHQLLVHIRACAVCRTDLHVVDGELPNPTLPIIPGHEIVGIVEARGPCVQRFAEGDRVGVSWLGRTCGVCGCQRGDENLCDAALFTGYTVDGGYAEYTVADERYCFAIPNAYDDLHAAPLLCAGLIGYRSLKKTGDSRRLGIYGFGAAAHIVTQLARWQDRQVYGFTRPGDSRAQDFARDLGAVWAGGSDERPPERLDAAIIFAPVGSLIPVALRALDKGGTVVCGGIHMSDIPAFPYDILWDERTVSSVANLTRADAEEFLALAPKVPIHTQIETYPLEDAVTVLDRLRNGQMTGAAVLVP